MKKITVGILTSLTETADLLTALIPQTEVAVLTAKINQSSSPTELSLRQLIEAAPEVIIAEVRDPASALKGLQVLHAAIPGARLLVTSHVTDPQLILEAMRSGVSEFLPHPVSQSTLLQAFIRHIAENESATNHARSKQGAIYCVTSPKHGSGATTLALNLAGIIAARSKQRVCLIDMDRPVGDAAAYLNIKPAFAVSDAVAAGSRLDAVLLESYTQVSNGFHLLAGSREYAANSAISSASFARLLEVARESFDHTIVDLPAILEEDQIRLIARDSKTILVVLTPELPTIWRAERLLSYLTKLDAAGKTRVVLNRTTRSDEINDQDIERLLGREIHCRLPNDYGACIKAINSGRLLDATNGKHLYRAVQALAADLTGLAAPAERRGLFGMFAKQPAPGDYQNA